MGLNSTPVKSCSVLRLRANSESSDTSDIHYPLFAHVPILIFLSPLFRFCSSLLSFLSDPFLIIMRLLTMWFRIPHAPVSCVDSTSSCLHDHSSPRTLVSVPALPLDSEPLLYLNPLYLSIQTNLIIAFYLRSFAFLSLHSLLRFIASTFVSLPTNSLSPDFCPTPVSDLLRNYRTYR